MITVTTGITMTVMMITSGGEDVSEDYDFVDHEVVMPDGSHCHRKGRYPRFFSIVSLLFQYARIGVGRKCCMTFVFGDLLVFLIGFYVERKSADCC